MCHNIKNIDELSKQIGYNFLNKSLLIEALSHPSLSFSEKKKHFNYERLELLGDSVLSTIIIEFLLKIYPNFSEGQISKIKSNLVKTDTLSFIGKKINIDKYILMTKGEEKNNGRLNKKNIENVIEAIIGAIYIDSGIESAKKFIQTHWKDLIKTEKIFENDPKSSLQEWLQQHNYNLPKYTTIKEEIDKKNNISLFTIKLEVKNFPTFINKANAKKKAEILDAIDMLNYIKTNIINHK